MRKMRKLKLLMPLSFGRCSKPFFFFLKGKCLWWVKPGDGRIFDQILLLRAVTWVSETKFSDKIEWTTWKKLLTPCELSLYQHVIFCPLLELNWILPIFFFYIYIRHYWEFNDNNLKALFADSFVGKHKRSRLGISHLHAVCHHRCDGLGLRKQFWGLLQLNSVPSPYIPISVCTRCVYRVCVGIAFVQCKRHRCSRQQILQVRLS